MWDGLRVINTKDFEANVIDYSDGSHGVEDVMMHCSIDRDLPDSAARIGLLFLPVYPWIGRAVPVSREGESDLLHRPRFRSPQSCEPVGW